MVSRIYGDEILLFPLKLLDLTCKKLNGPKNKIITNFSYCILIFILHVKIALKLCSELRNNL